MGEGRVWDELFLVFPFGWWDKDGRWRSGGPFFFAFEFASSFALSFFARTVSLSRFTSVLAMVLCLVVGVGFCGWFVFSCFGCFCVVVSLFSLVHHTLRHT